ncbi:insulinase family protein [uncultured Bacteroides sp.]|uniref:M16 family metallopeptidase n=1 Tax=uncultured Bacteroides sp. TaxID=162156 RepID=UPI002AA77B97|nr:insulinase family protein [uncultured Bacteroides sp.]
MKKKVLSAILCGLLSGTAHAQLSGSLNIKEYKLSNGLSVWLNEDHSQPKIFGAVVVKAGSKDCPNTGIAHYFEHMMFKGTDKIGTTNYNAEKVLLDAIAQKYDELALTKDDVKRKEIQKEINALTIRSAEYVIPNEFDRLISRYGGSSLNASTSDDCTIYHNVFSPQYINQWAELNSERLINPVFRLFQSELETVYEEKNMYNDMMGYQALEKVTERFFAPHPYAFPIVGSTENLKNPKLSDMRTFFESYYVAGNMGLILSGDFNTEEILPILEKTFSRIRKGEAPKREIISPTPFSGKEEFKIKVPIPIVKILVLGWRSVPANHEDEVALRIAIGLLNNDNSTGYLDKLTVEGKVMETVAMNKSLNEAGVVGVLTVPKLLFQTYGKAKRLVMHEIKRVKDGDFSDEFFNSLKLEQKRNYERDLENIDSRAQKMLSLFSEGKNWSDYLNEVQRIDALTKDDIIKVANKYFTDNYLQVTKKTGHYPKNNLTKPGFAPIIPKNTESKSDYAKSMEQIKTLDAHPRFLDFDNDAKAIQIAPKVVLYAVANPVNDIFTLNLEYGKGTLESKLLSPMSTYLNLLGTDSLSFEQFRGKLQNLGSTLSFVAEQNKFVVQISGFDKNFDTTLALTGEFLNHVKAEPKKMKKVIDQAKLRSKAIKQSPDELASALLNKVRYGDQSEYLNCLSVSEIKKLKGKDLIAEFNEVKKVECNIHYCGNLSAKVVAAQIMKNIAVEDINIASHTPIYRESNTYTKPTVYFIDDSKSSQSIVAGYIQGGVSEDVSSRYKSVLFNNYFGGSMSSIVFQQIREFRSLAYRVRATYKLPSYKYKDKSGQLLAMLSTQCDKTTDAMDVLDSLIKQMPVKAERVETARQDVVNEANNEYPSLRERSSKIASLIKEGYISDPNKELIAGVANMDIKDIVDFYNQNIKGRLISYIVVGNAKKINMNKLSGFGKIVKVKAKEVYK